MKTENTLDKKVKFLSQYWGLDDPERYHSGNDMWRLDGVDLIVENNQWIRIEEDGSNLPKEEDEYMFYTVHGKITRNYYNPHWEITNRKKYLDAYTHYQPIVKPELPLW